MKRWRLDAGPMRGGKAGFSQYCRVKRALLRGGSLHQASLSFLSPCSDTLSDNEVTYIINIVQEGVPHFCNAESIHLNSLLLLPPSWISQMISHSAWFAFQQVSCSVTVLLVLLFHQHEDLVCFRDIRPGAPHHYLIVPRYHMGNCKTLKSEHIPLGKPWRLHAEYVCELPLLNLMCDIIQFLPV